MKRSSILPTSFYHREVTEVARDLIGKVLVRRNPEGQVVGRIVETEAYLAVGDSACHAYRGRTRRNEAMYDPGGVAYVYAIHSQCCFNVVADSQDVPCAVLIRAVEPLEGLELMQRRRSARQRTVPPTAWQPRDLARGPGRLCQAFAIDRHLNHAALSTASQLWIRGGEPAGDVKRSVRIGVTSAQNLPLRFLEADNPFVSGPQRLNAQAQPA